VNGLAVQVFAVAVGGALGAVLRFLNGLWMRSWWHDPFPLATFGVNAVGSFCLGVLTALALEHPGWPAWLRLALGTGLLGALTTFSTFSVETLLLLEQGQWLRAVANVLLNVGVCIGAVWLGFQVVR